MFGAFNLGAFIFGESIWGPKWAPNANPDIDGNYSTGYSPAGNFYPDSIATGGYGQSYVGQAKLETTQIPDTGIFLPAYNGGGEVKRIK